MMSLFLLSSRPFLVLEVRELSSRIQDVPSVTKNKAKQGSRQNSFLIPFHLISVVIFFLFFLLPFIQVCLLFSEFPCLDYHFVDASSSCLHLIPNMKHPQDSLSSPSRLQSLLRTLFLFFFPYFLVLVEAKEMISGIESQIKVLSS
jgi:hypothetical protein